MRDETGWAIRRWSKNDWEEGKEMDGKGKPKKGGEREVRRETYGKERWKAVKEA